MILAGVDAGATTTRAVAVASTKLSQVGVEQTLNVRTSPTTGGTVANGVTRARSKAA